jgi:HTH-type transcriptional regulator / antitoxin HigA
MINEKTFEPDYCDPPGHFLKETMEALSLSAAELARRMGRPEKLVSEILSAKSGLTPETALELEQVLGIPARFWNNLETRYQEFQANQEFRHKLETFGNWLQTMPYNKLQKLSWVKNTRNKEERIRELLQFFGISAPDQWHRIWEEPVMNFRLHHEIKTPELSAWLTKGEQVGRRQNCNPYNEATFEEEIIRIRQGLLTGSLDHLYKDIQRHCNNAGVAFVIIPEVPGAKVSGASKWLSKDRALIQISGRYKTSDHFWFTFFHEAAHILKHSKKGNYLDWDHMGSAESAKEEEANWVASEILIPKKSWQHFVQSADFSKSAVQTFAEIQKIPVSIVIGRLQHERVIPWKNPLNRLKENLYFD